MARWSGAKARVGWYARGSRLPGVQKYWVPNPDKPNLKQSDASTWIQTAILGLMFWPITILRIVCLIIFKCTDTLTYISNVKKVRSKLSFWSNRVFQKSTKLVWSIDADINSGPMKVRDVPNFIDKLNESKHAGISKWRIPSCFELKNLRNIGEEFCFTDISSPNKHPVSLMLKDVGFKNVNASFYISSVDTLFVKYELIHMHVADEEDAKIQTDIRDYRPDTLEQLCYVWPVSGGKWEP